MNLRSLWDITVMAVERHPALGYIGAAAPTITGFSAILESAREIGGVLSIMIGIAVGSVTLMIQLRILRQKEREDAQGKK